MKFGINKISFWAKSAVALVIVFCLFKIVDSRIECSTLEARKSELQKKIDHYSVSIEEKQDKLNTEFDREYIENYANENLGLYRPDVVIFSSDLWQ